MYFYVDESGNTGQNLFDPNQTHLYYGVLGCRKNLDIRAEPMLSDLRCALGVKRLHATELGVAKLGNIANSFIKFQKQHDVRMNFYSVAKRDHAVISFFDQVFDSGINDAVPWHYYWTPLRYILLIKLAHLFDDELAKQAWEARLNQSADACAEQMKAICGVLREERLISLPDPRSREIIDGALAWAVSNADEINYGTSNRESALQISPNLVGFQQVLQGIAGRSESLNRPVRSIVVDRQSEFNLAQQFLNEIYRKMRGAKIDMPPGMPTFDWRHMPDQDIHFKSSEESAGLEMVDIYLWIMKRLEEKKSMSDEGRNLIFGQRHRGVRDEVSLRGIKLRWSFLLDLPEPDPESAERAQEIMEMIEQRRMEALKSL